MRFCAARRNDVDDLLAVLFVPCVNFQHDHSSADCPERDPAFFFVGRFVFQRQRIGIVKNENCGLKANIVLEQVLPILVFVPFETHGRVPAWNDNSRELHACQY